MQLNTNKHLQNAGFLLPDGSPNKEKFNLLSGAYTPIFVEAIWALTDGDRETMHYMSDIFTNLYDEGKDRELMDMVQLLYSIMGLVFPDEVKLLARYPETMRCYLYEFLLDFDDALQDFIVEAADE